MTVNAAIAITADELLAMGDIGRCELIRGELIMMSPSSAGHGVIASRFGVLIGAFVEQQDLGITLAAETGFTIETGPDTVRAPDVAVVFKTRAAEVIKERGFGQGAPDLAVEVLSPDESRKAAVAKCKMWIQTGARSAWLIDPAKRTADIYRADQSHLQLTDKDALVDQTVLPGFSVPLTQVFRVL